MDRTPLRTAIALAMLLIASLGAGLAGWTAIKQQASTNIERRLSQAQMMELAERLQFVEFSRSGKSLQERLERHQADARLHARLAAEAKADTAVARLRDLDAQEALLLANVVRPFVEALPNLIAADLSLDERRIGLIAAGSLQRRGFQASWIEGPAGDAPGAAQPAEAKRLDPHIRYDEKARIETHDKQVLALSLVVVALVLALAFLTFADLGSRRAVRSLVLGGAALVIAAGAVGAALRTDVDAGAMIAGVTIAFAVFVLLAYLLGWLRAPAETAEPLQPQTIDTQGFAGSQLQVQEAGGGFSRLVVVAITLTALASSIIGYWYVEASSQGDDAAYQAYQQQLDFVKRSGKASTAILGTFDGLVDLYERRVRCGAARNRAELAREGTVVLPADAAAASARLICERLDEASWPGGQGKALVELDRRFGPDVDPRFPQRLQQHVIDARPGLIASEALALWDGYGELSAFWSAKTTSYLACLTIVAIALYLFGQALGMGQLTVTRAMAACGIAMTLGAFSWSALVWQRSLPTGAGEALSACPGGSSLLRDAATADPAAWLRAAAQAYADGANRLTAATSEQEYAAAIAALECAVAARPNLALAHHDLAGAKAISQSAHKGQSYYSLPSKDRLEEIERNAAATVESQQRLALAPNSYALNSHAVALWGLGIRDGKLAPIQRALALVDRAIELAEPLEADRRRVSADAAHNLYPWFTTLPLLYLNQGLFRIAVDRIEEGQAAVARALALGSARDWSLAGTMTTATALLHANCDRLHPAGRCAAIRSALAAYRRALLFGDATSPADEGAGRIERAGASVSITDVVLGARIPGFNPQKDRLAVVWSVTDPQWSVPDALTMVAPPIERHELRTVGERDHIFRRSVLSATGFRRCLPQGSYSAEVFLNGRLAATATARREGGAMTAAALGALNLALCHPDTWTAWRPDAQPDWSAEPAAGFANARGAPVAFLFSFAAPRDAGRPAAEQTGLAIERALRLLSRYGVLTGSLESLKARSAPCDKVAAEGIAHGALTALSGTVHVALLLAGAIEGASACEIMRSVTVMHGLPG